jgi:hypothetical protein
MGSSKRSNRGLVGYLNGSLVGSQQFTGTLTGRPDLLAPFGSALVDELRFVAVPSSSKPTSTNNDYGAASVSVSAIPQPATVLLMGSGLAALAARQLPWIAR